MREGFFRKPCGAALLVIEAALKGYPVHHTLAERLAAKVITRNFGIGGAMPAL